MADTIPLPKPRMPTTSDFGVPHKGPLTPDSNLYPDKISLEENMIPIPDTISLDTGERGVPMQPPVAAVRATQVQFGLGNLLQKDHQTIFRDLMDGQEKQLRNDAAAAVNLDRENKKRDFLLGFAQQKGAPLTQEEVKHINDTVSSLSNPAKNDSVFEEYFSKEYLSLVAKTGNINPDSSMYAAIREAPKAVQAISDYGKTWVTKKLFLQNLAEDYEAQEGKQSWPGWTADRAKEFLIPGYEDVKFRGTAPGTGYLTGGLRGGNKAVQFESYMNLPMSEFTVRTKTDLDAIAVNNPGLAAQLARQAAEYTTSERAWDNLANVIDISFIKPIAALEVGSRLLRRLGVINSAKESVKAAVKATAEGVTQDVPKMIEASGNIHESVTQRLAAQTIANISGTGDPIKQAHEAMSSIVNTSAKNMTEHPGSHGTDLANKIAEQDVQAYTKLVKLMEDRQMVDRTPAAAVKAVYDEAIKEVQKQYDSHNIMNVGAEPIRDTLTGVRFATFDIGKKDGSLFFNKIIAEQYIKAHGELAGKAVPVENKANGFVIRIFHPIAEDMDIIRNSASLAPKSQVPESWLSNIIGHTKLGKYRVPDEILPEAEVEARKAATVGVAPFHKLAQEVGEGLTNLTRWHSVPWSKAKQRWDEFNKVINAAREARDPADPETLGRFFKNEPDLDSFYQKTVGRSPDQQEVEAYFSYKRLLEMRRQMQNMNVYKDKLRVGVQQHQIIFKDALNNPVRTPLFDAREISTLPEHLNHPKGDAAILMATGKAGNESVEYMGHMNPSTYKAMIDRIERGELKVFELYDEGARPFQGFGRVKDERIRYVVTDAATERSNITWKQLDSKLRPELEYEYTHYLKQANVKRETINEARGHYRYWYEGDTNIMPIAVRGMGKQFADGMNQVRKLLKENKINEAKEFVNSGEAKLPWEWEEVKQMFLGDDYLPGKLSLDHDIKVVPKRQQIADFDNSLQNLYGDEFKNGTRSGLARQHNSPLAAPEEYEVLKTAKDIGTKENPVYKLAPAKQVDAITTLQRGLNNMINTTLLDDYKILSIENWLQRANEAGALRASQEEVRASPLWHFYNATKAGLKGDQSKINQLENQHFQIRQLLGFPNDIETQLQSVAQKLSDSIFNAAGGKIAQMLTPNNLTHLADPTAMLRKFAFHEKLGLFNAPQLINQMQSFANIIGVAGLKYAVPGTKGALLHLAASMNQSPEFLAKLDTIASKQIFKGTSIWKPGEWLEAYKFGRDSGFLTVGAEQAFRDTLLNHKVITTGATNFLEWGTWFFKAGEASTRGGAWYTAFREFRDLHPTGRITKENMAEITNRADLLNNNMTRASSSALHTGIMALPTQFASYQLRLAEQFLGKRLTLAERIRLFSTYSAIYGLPSAAAVTGLPVVDHMRKSAVDAGYVVGENYITDAFTNGIPSMLSSLMFAKPINFQSLGPKGISLIQDSLRSDKTWMEVLGGPSVGSFTDLIGHGDNFIYAMKSAIQGEGRFKPMTSDLMDIAKDISSVNSGWKLYMALHTGRWLSKKETNLDSVSNAQAVMQFLTGTASVDLANIQAMKMSMDEQKELNKKALDFFKKDFRRAQYALKDNNVEQHIAYINRAFDVLRMTGYPEHKYAAAVREAYSDHRDLVQNLDYSYYFKDAPPAERAKRLETLQRVLRQRMKSNGGV